MTRIERRLGKFEARLAQYEKTGFIQYQRYYPELRVLSRLVREAPAELRERVAAADERLARLRVGIYFPCEEDLVVFK